MIFSETSRTFSIGLFYTEKKFGWALSDYTNFLRLVNKTWGRQLLKDFGRPLEFLDRFRPRLDLAKIRQPGL
jgi:hypothetical protein